MTTTKTKRTFFEDLREGLLDAIAFERGELIGARVDRVLVTSRQAEAEAPPAFGPRRIIELRTKTMQLSQTMFASALNVSPETVRAWEQGKHTPGGPALRLLEIAELDPRLILAKVFAKGAGPSAVREVVRPGRKFRTRGVKGARKK